MDRPTRPAIGPQWERAMLGPPPRSGSEASVGLPDQVEGGSNTLGDVDRRLVLPGAYDMPAGALERGIDAAVPGGVALELGDPIVEVAPRNIAVLWAAMPETTVYEHREAPTSEDHVRPDAKPFDLDRVVDTKPQPPRVEQPSERPLRAGVPTSVSGHPSRDGVVERDWIRERGHLRGPPGGELQRSGAAPRAGMIRMVAAKGEVALRDWGDGLRRRAVLA